MTSAVYVVLDTAPHRSDGIMYLDAPSVTAEVSLDLAEFTPAEAADERRRPNRRMARVMPTSLVHPLASAPELVGSAWGMEAINATKTGATGHGVTVAVLDTGIAADHPAFAGVTIEQEDFTGEGNGDTSGHGTHCAGTILGRDVGGRRIGIARGVERLLVGKVLNSDRIGDTATTARAIQWAAASGAHVISLSLAIDFTRQAADLRLTGVPLKAATSQALSAYRDNFVLFTALGNFVRSQQMFGQAGLLIAAAGNESDRDGRRPYSATCGLPAAVSSFIAVGALSRNAMGNPAVASFSNDGARVSAPGVDIVSAALGGGLATLSGTSMAAPHAAGVAALWAEHMVQMEFDAELLGERLIGSARELPLPSDAVGAGLIQAPP